MTIAFRSAVAATLVAGAAASHAAELANVISSTPIVVQVAVPQQACRDEQRLVQRQPSGVGALVGAVTGGLLGSGIGHGGGRAAATGLGAVLGSVVGNNVEAGGYPPAETTVRSCQTVSSYENRTVGYDVVYEYAGQRYTTRLPNDPGRQLPVDVRPVNPASRAAPAAAYADPYAEPAPSAAYTPVVPAPVYAPLRVGVPVPSVVVAPYVGYGWRGRPRWY